MQSTQDALDFYNITAADLCNALSARVDRDVIDRTGLVGMFDVHLKLASAEPPSPDLATPTAPASPAPGGMVGMLKDLMRDQQKFGQERLIAALSQVGLKLDTGKAPGEVIVIDSIQRPTEN